MVRCNYVKWTTPRKRKIDLYCPLFNQSFEWDAASVRLYGMLFELGGNMTLVDADFCKQFPQVEIST